MLLEKAYPLLRPLLFRLPPEMAHDLSLKLLCGLASCCRRSFVKQEDPLATSKHHHMGLTFDNPVGLAAGLDKNGDYLKGLAMLGFGFIEIGTLTVKPQDGNPRPRLFRLPSVEALINRMGFNNHGLTAALENIQPPPYDGVLGINIGKNKHTPNEYAAAEYVAAFEQAYPFADYITINVSSPNTPDLRQLQAEEALTSLLGALKNAQQRLMAHHHKKVPLVVKVAPDLTESALLGMASVFEQQEVEGVIATNTTHTRPLVTGLKGAKETGGLSGRPLKALSDQGLRILSDALKHKVTLIAVGGILTPEDAREKMALGADLVQLYTGLIYRGPKLVRESIEALSTLEQKKTA